MSSDSDSEEFFDADDGTPSRNHVQTRPVEGKLVNRHSFETVSKLTGSSGIETGKPSKNEHEGVVQRFSLRKTGSEHGLSSEDSYLQQRDRLESSHSDCTQGYSLEELREAEQKAKEIEKRKKRLEEMRRRMLTDDDDVLDFPSSEQSSKASSVDGVFITVDSKSKENAQQKTTDGQSLLSLGNAGLILGETDRTSVSSRESIYSRSTQQSLPSTSSFFDRAPEPDIVASTKGDRGGEGTVVPRAPPRRKRKIKPPASLDTQKANTNIQNLESKHEPPHRCLETQQGLPSPTTTVESLARELENSLDLKSALRGEYIVKPQDHEHTRAESSNYRSPSNTLIELPLSTGEDGKRSPIKNSLERVGGTPEGSMQQMNMMMRTRSDSGRPLTDLEILEQITVTNLDTGERVPLSLAEERLPKCVNPLSLHIMRLTSQYVSNSEIDKGRDSDEDSVDIKKTSTDNDPVDSQGFLKKTTRFRKMLGKKVEKTVHKLKTVADEVYHLKHNDELDSSEEDVASDLRHTLKVKAASSHKGPYEFDGVRLVQEITGEHTGAIWTMKFSSCGRLLATAGQDHILRIWVLRDSYAYFDDMRQKYNAEARVSPAPSQESLTSQLSGEEASRTVTAVGEETVESTVDGPFMSKPFCTYEGHTADLLDVSWSKNYFILSSSMDKTVRLWHISRRECLCCFQHIDFVTAIAFHPRDDRYFLSGSLDGKLRLWNIPDKKVALWNEVDGNTKLITAASFCQNGKFAVVGSYDGRCIFYNTEQLKYYTQINVRSTRGKNAQGRKISGIESMPGEDKILVTSNDSRIRLYDLRDLSLTCKYKGYTNISSQIRASFSHDGKYVISGSENQFIYIWKTSHDFSKFSSARRDRNIYWEGIKAHSAVVTTAVFAPSPNLVMRQLDKTESTQHVGYVFVSADFNGDIKIFFNKPKPKGSTNV
ncbi:WD repeat-containing protein 44 [Tachypleus tridentatus]|uniref:WD repeat-containing protein 44 n=1 Tax=Tachypleus tridentatus TaxID=6853 RepID=UPI003FD33326